MIQHWHVFISLTYLAFLHRKQLATLQELWISYNNIEKLKEITVLAKLKVVYIDCYYL